ncbi:MAG: hypothetical protein ACLRMJ_00070 [Alistipes finegoldii]
MRDSPMDVKERPQNIVTFVSFRDMDNQSFAEATPTVRIGVWISSERRHQRDDVKPPWTSPPTAATG